MPNWVYTQIMMDGEEDSRRNVINFLKGKNGDVDFNNVIPMPEDLDIESSSRICSGIIKAWYQAVDIDEQIDVAKGFEEIYGRPITLNDIKEINDDSDEILGYQAISNKRKYGYTDWYSWRVDTWGTKWNAADVCVDEDCISFNTAWSFPFPILKELSKKFPDVHFDAKYVDYGIRENSGWFEFDGGKHVDMLPHGLDGSAAAEEFKEFLGEEEFDEFEEEVEEKHEYKEVDPSELPF